MSFGILISIGQDLNMIILLQKFCIRETNDGRQVFFSQMNWRCSLSCDGIHLCYLQGSQGGSGTVESSLKYCAIVYTNVCGTDVWCTKRSIKNSFLQD